MTNGEVHTTKGKTTRGSRVFLFVFRFCLPIALTVPFIFYSGAQDEMELPRDESKFTLGRIFFNAPMRGAFRDPIGFGAGPPWSHDWFWKWRSIRS